MGRLGYFCLCLAAAWVVLQASTARAATVDLYSIRVDENGTGSFVEYSPPVAIPANGISAGTLVSSPIVNGGVQYVLPYTININANSNQWLTIYDSDGTTKSDMVQFANISDGLGGQLGVLNLYSKDSSGQLADVSPAVWATLIANSGGFSSQESTSDVAFYSTFGDPSGVPGDPVPHPTVEADYYIQSVVPEPTTLAMLCGFAGMGLLGRPWRRRNRGV